MALTSSDVPDRLQAPGAGRRTGHPSDTALGRLSARLPGTGPQRALVAVAGAYAVAQLLLVPDVDLESDEAVYLSQVSGAAPVAPWEAHRARGMPLLVAPVASLTPSLGAVRGYLLVLSAVALLAAYWPWLRVLPGYVAPLAAALFAGCWPALFYGAQVSPNLWVAFGAVAGVGWTLRLLAPHDPDDPDDPDPSAGPPAHRSRHSRRLQRSPRSRRAAAALGTAGSFAFVALMRPSESVWTAAGLLGAVIVAAGLPSARPTLGRWRATTFAVAAVGAGLVVGWAPWLVEAFLRFGGPLQRLDEASRLQDAGLFNTVPEHLRLLDGGLVCCFGRDRTPYVPVDGLSWWVGLAVLSAAGVVLAGRGVQRRAVGTAALAGLAVAGSYLTTSYAATRFLLPAYALLALPAALALLAVVGTTRRPVGSAAAAGGRWRAGFGLVAVLAVLLAYFGWHAATMVLRAGPAAASGTLVVPRAAQELRELGVRPPCAVLGARAPGIAYRLGCTSGGLGRARFLVDPAPAQQLQQDGNQVVVVWTSRVPARSYLKDWREVPLSRAPGYYAYLDEPEPR